MEKKTLDLKVGVFLLIILLTVPALAGNNSGAAFSTWPDTGMAKCYDANGTELNPCPAEGQHYYGQDAQYHGPARSYTLLGSGTMAKDNVTGLIWEMKTSNDGTANFSDPNDADNTYTWCDPDPDTNAGNQGTCGDHDTKDFIDQLNSGGGFGGSTDWRLPTFKELATLVDLGRIYPAIDPIFAATTKLSYYWSSTTNAAITDMAWMVYFSQGYDFDLGDGKSSGHYVRAVRGGPGMAGAAFVDNGDTVTDTVTCLQWQKVTMDTKNGEGPDTYTWQEALAASEGLSLAGHADWRLPNRNELRSLVDYSRYPAIDPIFAATTQASAYWSSTTYAGTTHYAWRVYFGNGYAHYASKSIGKYVRAVRGEQCIGSGMLGDIDLSGDVTLVDTILALQIVSGQQPSAAISLVADVNADVKIGIPEVIYTLQKVAKLR